MLREAIKEAWDIFCEEWGRSCLLFAGIAFLGTFHKESVAGATVTIPLQAALTGTGFSLPATGIYLLFRGCFSLLAKSRAEEHKAKEEIVRLKGKAPSARIRIIEKWDAIGAIGDLQFILNGIIENGPFAISNAWVRLISVDSAQGGAVIKPRDLKWAGDDRSRQTIPPNLTKTFDILKMTRNSLEFVGYEGNVDPFNTKWGKDKFYIKLQLFGDEARTPIFQEFTVNLTGTGEPVVIDGRA